MIIKFIIPHKELIEKNGAEVCLEIVPGTRHYLTHNHQYGKEENHSGKIRENV